VLNQTAIYAVRTMGFLAKQDDGNLVLSSTIATVMNIPRNFLSKIINRLTLAGLVLAIRGKGGGVKLARPAADIFLNEVVGLFMKVDDPEYCLMGLNTCNGSCGLHTRLRTISEQFKKILQDTTVDQIL